MAEPEVVKFYTRVGYINSNNRMTCHQQKGRGYGHLTVLKFAVCRNAARRAGLSATAELRVTFCITSYFFAACNRRQFKFNTWVEVTQQVSAYR